MFTEMRDKLRKWREDNCRNSEQIVDIGEELISEHASKLGDDSKSFCVSAKSYIRQGIGHCRLPNPNVHLCYVLAALSSIHILILLLKQYCEKS